nr:arginine--tRNA ligase [Helcococcus sueciensis]
MMDYKLEISNLLGGLDIGLSQDEILNLIEVPKNKELGDFSFPTFRLAKTMRKAPNIIAEDLVSKIQSELFSEVKTAGPYINFYLDQTKFNQIVLEKVFEEKYKYGSSKMGEGKLVTIDYSSPNIAKPFHIGHIRSTVIGDSLKRIFRFLGFTVESINYLGDYGTQFGVLISAYLKWGDKEVIDKDPIRELLKLYVRYTKESESDPALKDEARAWFKKLEEKDEFALETWRWFKEISLKEFNRVYDMLGIEFESYNGEYFHAQFIPEIREEIEKSGLLYESEGAQVIDMGEENPPAMIFKSDGSSSYITRDMATARYRKQHYDFYKNIYVVATQQNLHFISLFKILDKMGYDWAKDCVHVSFGMVSVKEGTLSTRRGNVIFLEDVLNKAIEKTEEIIAARNPNLENKDEIAKDVGIGAVKFQELFNQRVKDYVFDWDQLLNFEGETGPYVQYAHARANQILEKIDIEITDDVDFSLLKEPQEIELIKSIYNAPEAIIQAMEKYEPFIITRHVTEIAQKFNSFYNSIHILNSEEEEKKVRALLVYATKVTIHNLLDLLGIKSPNKM